MIGRSLVVKVFGTSTRVTAAEVERQQAIARVLTPSTLQRGSDALDRAVFTEARPPRPVGLRDGGPCPLCPSSLHAGTVTGGELVLRDDPIDGPRLECSASSFHNFSMTPKES